MGTLSDRRAYTDRVRAELRRLGAYQPDAPAGPFLRLTREFHDLPMPAEQAAGPGTATAFKWRCVLAGLDLPDGAGGLSQNDPLLPVPSPDEPPVQGGC